MEIDGRGTGDGHGPRGDERRGGAPSARATGGVRGSGGRQAACHESATAVAYSGQQGGKLAWR